MKRIQAMNAFVANEREDPMALATPVAIFAKDPLIRNKKRVGGLIMPFESVQQEEESPTPMAQKKIAKPIELPTLSC